MSMHQAEARVALDASFNVDTKLITNFRGENIITHDDGYLEELVYEGFYVVLKVKVHIQTDQAYTNLLYF